MEFKTCFCMERRLRTRSKNATTMASRTGDLDRLSGVELPLILQKKLKSQKQASGEEIKDRTTENELDDENADTVFTAEELEERVLKARAAISDIQKQLLIGEESYHEETNAHGNLFRGGWELFIDVKDSAPSGHKRMPADYRWFSGSCLSTFEKNQGRSISMKSLSSIPPAKKAAPVARSASQASNPSAASSVSQGGSGNAAVSDGIKGNIEAVSITQGASAAQAMMRASKASSASTARSAQLAGGSNSTAQGATSSQGNKNTTKADPMPAPAAVPPPKEVSGGRKARKRKSSE